MVVTVSRTSALTIAPNTLTAANFNSVVSNDMNVIDGFQTTGITTTTIVFPRDGIYINFNGTYVITANVSFAATAANTGIRSLILKQNNTTIAQALVSVTSSTEPYSLNITAIAHLFISDVINIYYKSTAASSVSTATQNSANGTVDATLSVALLIQ